MSISDTSAGTAILDDFAQKHADSTIVGHILWTSVTKSRPIPAQEVRDLLATVGLEAHAPKVPAPSDVFRRVSKARKGKVELDDGTTLHIDVKEVVSNTIEVVRRVVVEHRDKQKQKLSYGQTWDLRYNLEHSTLDLYPITAEADGTIRTRDRYADPHPGDDIVAGLRAEYQANLGCVTEENLRAMLTNIVKDAMGVQVRETGAVHFMPRSQSSVVDALRALRRNGDQGLPGVSVHAVPLPDEAEHTDMLGGAITQATISQVDELIAELRKAKTGEKIGTRRMKTIMSERRDVKRRLVEFQGVLRDELLDAKGRVEILDKLMADAVGA